MDKCSDLILKKVINKLDLDKLRHASMYDLIGCPFSRIYGGLQTAGQLSYPNPCMDLCGVIFSYTISHIGTGCECPCMRYKKEFVKLKFWETVKSIRKEE